jgi:hypothetical protein
MVQAGLHVTAARKSSKIIAVFVAVTAIYGDIGTAG